MEVCDPLSPSLPLHGDLTQARCLQHAGDGAPPHEDANSAGLGVSSNAQWTWWTPIAASSANSDDATVRL